jgi:hypothetical protein
MADQRLKGQEISIRIVEDGVVVDQIDSISTFNDEVKRELKEAGYLGEVTNRFDEILNGYGGSYEFHTRAAAWIRFDQAINDRATRVRPNLVINVIRTDLYPNGDSIIYTYQDVFFASTTGSIGSRGDYAKVAQSFGCSERPIQINQLP